MYSADEFYDTGELDASAVGAKTRKQPFNPPRTAAIRVFDLNRRLGTLKGEEDTVRLVWEAMTLFLVVSPEMGTDEILIAKAVIEETLAERFNGYIGE